MTSLVLTIIWVDPFHKDNNLYGINNGEYYNWILNKKRGGTKVVFIPKSFLTSQRILYFSFEFYDYDGNRVEHGSRPLSEGEGHDSIKSFFPFDLQYLKSIKRRYQRRISGDIFTGPAWYLVTSTIHQYIDRAPVRCIKE